MLKDYEKIVVGLDLDEAQSSVTLGSRKATHQAIWLARANTASIRFVHSVYADDYRTALPGSGGLVHEGLSEAGEKALSEVVALAHKAELEAELVVTEDRPWLDITKMALRGEADLVVVGKRNEEAKDGRRLGSIASKLLRKCPCHVWVVKPEHDLAHKNVLAATDLTEVGDDAVNLAWELSRHMQCQLHVVHAWQRPMALQMKAARISSEEYKSEVRSIEDRVRKHIEKHLTVDALEATKVHMANGSPASIIMEAIEHLDPDLIVMGTISRKGIAGLLIGSTAERMVEVIDCSILAIKPEGFESPVKL